MNIKRTHKESQLPSDGDFDADETKNTEINTNTSKTYYSNELKETEPFVLCSEFPKKSRTKESSSLSSPCMGGKIIYMKLEHQIQMLFSQNTFNDINNFLGS